MRPDETREFEEAVSRARERLADLSALMDVANQLDQAADQSSVDLRDGDGPTG